MNKVETVVVTGATSMIGVALIDQCIRNEIKVYAVVKPESTKLERLKKFNQIIIKECEIDSYNNLPEIISEKCDVFYHLAWLSTGRERNRDISAQLMNVSFTIDAVRSAKRLGCHLFIGTGSQAEYGRNSPVVVSPDMPVNPDTPYGIAKYTASRCAFYESEQINLDCIWARIFSVYGVYDKPTTMISSSLRKLLNHELTMFTTGEQYWDYLFSEDAGEALFRIGQFGKGGSIYCVGSGEKNKIKDYIITMRDIIDPGLEINFGGIPIPAKGPVSICANITTLTTDTGFIPRFSFSQGIHETIEWLKQG